MSGKVGVVGLGNMGGALARNLVEAGFTVFGVDPDPERAAALGEAGGTSVESPAAVARESDIVILSLPNVTALETVLHGEGGLVTGSREGLICIESGTFPLAAKMAARDALAARGIHLLDCTVSGTGSQAVQRDIVLYTSGPADILERCAPVFQAISKAWPRVGDFGAGSILKFVSNLLVTVHTVAAAEALTLATKSGLDPSTALELMAAGAGQSRMLEVRGPIMTSGDYDIGSATVDTLAKDTEIILDFAAKQNAPVPMLATAATFLVAAAANGLNDQDPAVVREIFGMFAGLGET